MSTGMDIKRVYDAMVQIFGETGSVIAAVNDTLAKKGFVSPNGTGVIWDTSKSYLNPEFWMPYFQQRIFIEKTKDVKDKVIGINIFFDHGKADLLYPVISCGLLIPRKGSAITTGWDFYHAGWNGELKATEGKQKPLFYYTADNADKNVFETIQNYFIPLDKITGMQQVEEMIVTPLLSMFHGDFNSAYEKIETHAVTIDEFTDSNSAQ